MVQIITEPDKQKSSELNEILLERLKNGDKTPIKMIQTISGNKKVKKFLFNFVANDFERKHQFVQKEGYIPAFQGSADSTSYKLDLDSNEKSSALSEADPVEFQATLFINNVINFEL